MSDHPSARTLREVLDRLRIGMRILKTAKTEEQKREAVYAMGGLAIGLHSYVSDELKKMGELPAVHHVSVCLVPKDDKVLCVWNRRYDGWMLPGGAVQTGEAPLVDAMRALKKETGLVASGLREVYAGELYSGDAPSSSDPGRLSIVHVFVVTAFDGEPAEQETGSRVEWITIEEFVQNVPFKAFYEIMFASDEFRRAYGLAEAAAPN